MGENKQPNKSKSIIKKIVTIISWIAFSLLILVGAALLYYVIATNIYASKGEAYEPPFSLYTIISPSMEPKVKVYDVIVDFRVKKPEDIKKGDIITFISNSAISSGMTVTHRVEEVLYEDGVYKYRTKGDNNPTSDSGLVEFSAIKGRTAFKIPQLGRIQFFLASKGGWFFAILVPAIGIIVYDVLKLLKIVGVKGKINKLVEKDNPQQKEAVDVLESENIKIIIEPDINPIEEKIIETVSETPLEEQPSPVVINTPVVEAIIEVEEEPLITSTPVPALFAAEDYIPKESEVDIQPAVPAGIELPKEKEEIELTPVEIAPESTLEDLLKAASEDSSNQDNK